MNRIGEDIERNRLGGTVLNNNVLTNLSEHTCPQIVR